MQRRKWTSQQKLQIALEGLSGQIEISKLCAKYQVSQTQYYQWRDHLLKSGHQAFETKNITKKEQYLESEVVKLKRIIGDLTVELKKANTSYEKNKILIGDPTQSAFAWPDQGDQNRSSSLGLSSYLVISQISSRHPG